MIDLECDILMPDGTTVPASHVKPSVAIADFYGRPQTVRRTRTTSEKEYHMLEFENGSRMFCLPYLSIMTRDNQIDANCLEAGDTVLGFRNGEFVDIKVTDSISITIFNKKLLGMPKKVKLLFFETYEDMPFVCGEVVIGMRKQIRSISIEDPLDIEKQLNGATEEE